MIPPIMRDAIDIRRHNLIQLAEEGEYRDSVIQWINFGAPNSETNRQSWCCEIICTIKLYHILLETELPNNRAFKDLLKSLSVYTTALGKCISNSETWEFEALYAVEEQRARIRNILDENEFELLFDHNAPYRHLSVMIGNYLNVIGDDDACRDIKLALDNFQNITLQAVSNRSDDRLEALHYFDFSTSQNTTLIPPITCESIYKRRDDLIQMADEGHYRDLVVEWIKSGAPDGEGDRGSWCFEILLAIKLYHIFLETELPNNAAIKVLLKSLFTYTTAAGKFISNFEFWKLSELQEQRVFLLTFLNTRECMYLFDLNNDCRHIGGMTGKYRNDIGDDDACRDIKLALDNLQKIACQALSNNSDEQLEEALDYFNYQANENTKSARMI